MFNRLYVNIEPKSFLGVYPKVPDENAEITIENQGQDHNPAHTYNVRFFNVHNKLCATRNGMKPGTNNVKFTKQEAINFFTDVYHQSSTVHTEVDVMLNGKKVGTTEGKSIWFKSNLAPGSIFNPIVSSVKHSEITSEGKKLGVIASGLSRLKIQMETSGQYGARTKDSRVEVDFQTTPLFGKEVVTPIIPHSDNYDPEDLSKPTIRKYNAITYDNRNLSGSKKVEYACYRYEAPAFDLDMHPHRVTKEGVPAMDGEYLSFGKRSRGKIANIGNNKGNIKIKIKEAESSLSWETVYDADFNTRSSVLPEVVTGKILNPIKSYEIQIVVTDILAEHTRDYLLGSEATIMDFRGDGKGMAIGKISEREGFEMGYPSIFYEDMVSVKTITTKDVTGNQTTGITNELKNGDKVQLIEKDGKPVLSIEIGDTIRYLTINDFGKLVALSNKDTPQIGELFTKNEMFIEKDVVDFNDAIEPGFYPVQIVSENSVKNGPPYHSWSSFTWPEGTLIVIRHQKNLEDGSINPKRNAGVTQLLFRTNGNIYYRMGKHFGLSTSEKVHLSWSEWVALNNGSRNLLKMSLSGYSINLDEAREAGQYYVEQNKDVEELIIGAPIKKAFYLDITAMGNGNVKQTFTTFDNSDIFVRTYYSYQGRWSKWQTVPTYETFEKNGGKIKWEKHGDGKLVEYGTIDVNTKIDEAYGALYRSGPFTHYFAGPFVDTPDYFNLSTKTWTTNPPYINSLNKSSFVWRALNGKAREANPISVSYYAVGRWR